MPASMTGFGTGQGPVGRGTLQIELKSVNHRHLTVSLRAPTELSHWEPDFREALRRAFDRGHVTATVRWLEPPAAPSSGVDAAKVKAAAKRLRAIAKAAGLKSGVSLDLLLRQPEVMTTEHPEYPWAEAAPLLDAAVGGCRSSRLVEGAALATELMGRLDRIGHEAKRLAARAPERVVRERDRLRAAVATLLDGRPVDETRMVQEIAFLAEKLDVTEELVRLEAHLTAARTALGSDRAVGKQLGFLAQEIGREINTVGSKANDAVMQHIVVEMKGELERFREQLENLE